MKKLLGFLVLSLCVSCDLPQEPDYHGSVSVHRTNGKVTKIEVGLPYNNNFTLHRRKEAMVLIEELESLLVDLKQAAEQMEVPEPR